MGVDRAAFERCIRNGGVAVFPADTVYGLACDPLSPDAVARVESMKGREAGKPAAVMYFDGLMMRELVGDMGPRTRAAAGALLPGPVTLVIANPAGRYPLACGANPSRLGVRLIAGPLAGAACVVMQTSANPSGGTDPRRAEDVDPGIREGADLVVDAGELPGTPSTVVDISDLDGTGRFAVLREGAVPTAQVTAVLGATVGP